MENDVLKNKIAPWQEKGRWYHGFINPTTQAFITKKTDAYLTANCGVGANFGLLFIRPNSEKANVKILDVKVKPKGSVASSNNNYASKYFYSDGRFGVATVPSNFSGTVEVWVFIVDEPNN